MATCANERELRRQHSRRRLRVRAADSFEAVRGLVSGRGSRVQILLSHQFSPCWLCRQMPVRSRCSASFLPASMTRLRIS